LESQCVFSIAAIQYGRQKKSLAQIMANQDEAETYPPFDMHLSMRHDSVQYYQTEKACRSKRGYLLTLCVYLIVSSDDMIPLAARKFVCLMQPYIQQMAGGWHYYVAYGKAGARSPISPKDAGSPVAYVQFLDIPANEEKFRQLGDMYRDLTRNSTAYAVNSASLYNPAPDHA